LIAVIVFIIVKTYDTVLDFVRNREMITILCAGSRGDFQPYIALAQELMALGKAVRIAGNRSFAQFIQSYGIEFFPINADMESLQVDPRMLQAAASADNPFKMLLAFNKMKEYGIYMVHDYFAACEGSDVIVYHPGCTIGYFAAQLFGIPSILAAPFPMHRTNEYLSVVMYGRMPANRFSKALSYTLLHGMLWMASKDAIKGFWQQKFGQAPADFGVPFARLDAGHPAVISCSNAVFARPHDWSADIHQHGYWFAREPQPYVPSAALADFLAHDTKPIYVGFGSMTGFGDQTALGETVVQALVKSGKRGVVSGLGQIANLPESIIAIDAVPHSWLFPQMDAVCHHGGAGTTAAGLRAGVPNLIVPFANDQFAWAQRATDLGVAPQAIARKQVTVARLAQAFQQVDSPSLRHNATLLAQQIAQEDGARRCAEVIAVVG
jgi:sterol 3beta-glucosyltransferase